MGVLDRNKSKQQWKLMHYLHKKP
uniref:Uncharacterized protein n=1 Tax=Arundo donax TaxID=35708 RepID=A0A0A8ZAD0_ARUDO